MVISPLSSLAVFWLVSGCDALEPLLLSPRLSDAQFSTSAQRARLVLANPCQFIIYDFQGQVWTI